MSEIFLRYKIPFFYLLLFVAAFILSSCKTREISGGPVFQLAPADDGTPKDIAAAQVFLDAIKLEIVDGNPEAAIGQLQTCLVLQPTNAPAMYRLARLYLETGRTEEAIGQIEKAIALEPGNIWYRLLYIDVLEQKHLYDKAAKELSSLISIKPEELDYYVALSRMYLLANKPLNAIRTLNEIETKIGVSEAVSVQKKNIYMVMKKQDKAVGEIEKLSAAFPDNTEYLRLLAEIYVVTNQENKVFEVYRKIADKDPTDGTAQLILADYYSRWKMPDKALEKALLAFHDPELGIENKISYMMMTYVNTNMVEEKKDELLNLIEIVFAIHPKDLRTYAFRADIYSILKEDEKALDDYKKALEGEKKNILLWQKVITAEVAANHYESALKYALEAVEYFPGTPELYLYLGLCYNRLSQYRKSTEQLKIGLNYLVDNKNLEFETYSLLGESYNSLKEYENSDLYFEKALKIDSMDASLLNNYAFYLSLRKEHLSKAKSLSERSLKIVPENANYLDTYGWILYQMSDYTEAENYLKKALDKKPWDPEVLEHYGDVLFKLGKVDEAVMHWEKAKSKGSVSELIDKKITGRQLYE